MRTFSHDPDFRRNPPSTGRSCCICQRGLKGTQGFHVYALEGGHELVAVDDVAEAVELGLFDKGWPADFVGPDCAKSIPAEFLEKC